uniref:Uncharacterized protein n=1 Tax=Candidatus Kentrum sp. SD TaxID=2126332 RepID=A0A450YQE5_9GAMM|nr:MAG: hypothetical protein BECKSD772F_GA0070984_101430 [Candidatus Kentron sp. SD]VFK43781.1 MAG: hypothetical protein BECKSD772E_GA0070983_102913 [Candidatus Kentron sp. SD]
MKKSTGKITNPLTLIAFFSGISESIALGVIPVLAKVGEESLPAPLLWFVVLFPTLIVVLFFITLNFNHKVLYAPGDFEDQKDFISIMRGDYDEKDAKGNKEIDSLRSFWKPDGENIDKENERIIRDWMVRNGMNPVSISAFLHSYDKQYAEFQRKAVNDLGIT